MKVIPDLLRSGYPVMRIEAETTEEWHFLEGAAHELDCLADKGYYVGLCDDYLDGKRRQLILPIVATERPTNKVPR